MTKKTEQKIGLALGGGAVKAIAHVGVLKVLQDINLPIHLVVGTSMGALMGAIFCQYQDARAVEKVIVEALDHENLRKFGATVENLAGTGKIQKKLSLQETFKKLHLYYQALKGHGVVEDKQVILAISDLLPEASIENLNPKFAAVATDLYSGEPVILNSGSLRAAVRASLSIPLIFPPVESDGKLLVDGMVTSLVPVEEAFQLGADVVIAVDVQGPIQNKNTSYNAIDIMVRCERISASRLKERNLQKAHVVIKPFSAYTRSWGFEQVLDHIKKGEEATRKQMSNIMEILKKSQKKSWLRKLEEFIKKLEVKNQ